MSVSVTALFVYPLKGARAIALERADVEARGVRHDRRFMIVDAESRFVTQRTHPMLAHVTVAIDGDALAIDAPRAGALRVPLVPAGGETKRVVIWKDACDAIDLGAEAAALFGELLGMRASLVYMPDSTKRQVELSHAAPGDIASFADAYPLLLTSTASLAELNRRLEERSHALVPMDRFRPNVVVTGAPAFAEDAWRGVKLGALGARVVKPCERCAVVTVDQRTGERGKEPLATLASFRSIANKTLFGQNVIPDHDGAISVGDELTLRSD